MENREGGWAFRHAAEGANEVVGVKRGYGKVKVKVKGAGEVNMEGEDEHTQVAWRRWLLWCWGELDAFGRVERG